VESSQTEEMKLDLLPIGAFDILLVVVLLLGFFYGRKHGLSEQLVSLFAWLGVVAGCAFAYRPLGEMLSQHSPISRVSCFLIAYIGGGLLILGAFSVIRRMIGGRLVGSDVFGRNEYYLGMVAGMIRFVCMLVAVLALLNAPIFTPQEVQAKEKADVALYGKSYFPGLYSIQSGVFKDSVSGQWIKTNLSCLLVTPTPSENKSLPRKQFEMP
jgi:uncharacterized membrane protein required for colicin V production